LLCFAFACTVLPDFVLFCSAYIYCRTFSIRHLSCVPITHRLSPSVQ
jgi:hypothetical protein